MSREQPATAPWCRSVKSSTTSPARYGNAPIDCLTHREIETWLRGINKAPQTRANYYRIAKRFFKWAHEKEEFIHRNPMIKVDEPRVPHEEPEVLTAEQMQICLKPAMDLDRAFSPFSAWEDLPASALRRSCG